jgi:ribA/ribD-fused uncharacterized protein
MTTQDRAKGNAIRFYQAKGDYGFLSNLWPCKVTVGDVEFDSAEHAYQWAKPEEEKVKEWIRRAPYPRLAAQVGHSLQWHDIDKKWPETKVDRMREVLEAKFLQNPELGDRLLETGDAILLEASKADRFWGEGKRRAGENMLGRLLMQLRDELPELRRKRPTR